MFDRIFGKGAIAERAKRAEMAGDLPRAAELYAEADEPAEAARVMILRGDGEAEPRARLVHFAQAVQTAPKDHPIAREAHRKRGALVVALSGEGALSAATRLDLLAAGADFELAGDHASAARAFRRAGDEEREAAALARAGDVDALEAALFEQGARAAAERRSRDVRQELAMLAANGQRREALALAESSGLTEEAARLVARRARGPIVRVSLRSAPPATAPPTISLALPPSPLRPLQPLRPLALLLGDEIVVGRSEGALQIASAAVSRQHLILYRENGSIFVRDRGSRNGTQLHGMALVGAVPIGEGLELRLGREVPIRVAPAAELPDAVAIDVAGERYVAPLGPARLGIGAWRIEASGDGWVDLVTDDAPIAIVDGLRVAPRVSLLGGDAFGVERGESAVLRIHGA